MRIKSGPISGRRAAGNASAAKRTESAPVPRCGAQSRREPRGQGILQRKVFQERLRFAEDARERRSLRQRVEIGRDLGMRRRERLDRLRVEQRGRRRTVGDGERRAAGMRHLREPSLDQVVGRAYRRARLLDAGGIARGLRAQEIGDDALHRIVHVVIEDTVPQPRVERRVRLVRDQREAARTVLLQILDDDGGLGNGAAACGVLQRRDLAERRQLQIGRARLGVAEVDHARLEPRAGLVQRHQHLLAERGQRMEMQDERHGGHLEGQRSKHGG